LKVLSNQRDEFPEVLGQVRYGNVGYEQAKDFRHQIVMNTEGIAILICNWRAIDK
jgi:hypothetical protein